MDLEQIPENLPIPEDDDAAKHLTGMMVPDIILQSTSDVLNWFES